MKWLKRTENNADLTRREYRNYFSRRFPLKLSCYNNFVAEVSDTQSNRSWLARAQAVVGTSEMKMVDAPPALPRFPGGDETGTGRNGKRETGAETGTDGNGDIHDKYLSRGAEWR